jgi:hypothetical protein
VFSLVFSGANFQFEAILPLCSVCLSGTHRFKLTRSV